MRTVGRVVAVIVVVVVALAGRVTAQSISASLQGVVTDAQGGVLPGVAVTVTNTETGLVRETSSDSRGFFRAAALPSGPYRVHVALDGFTPYERLGLVLTVEQTASVDIELGVASLSEAVIVQATAPLVDTSSSALGTTVTRQQLDNLPLSGRDFSGLARLAPGVTGVGGGGVTTGGLLSRNNSIVVDGTTNDEQGVAGARGSFSLESVREYVIYTNQFAAEHGQAAGALVSVVTRSGTNNVEGRVFAFHRDDAFDAQNPFSKAQQSGKAPFEEQRFGGFLGGPFIKSKWHYFLTYEGQRNGTTSVITSPLVPVDEREFPRTNTGDQYFFRTEYELPGGNRFGARYRIDKSSTVGGGIGGLSPYERGQDSDDKYHDTVLSLTSVLTSRTVNEFRALRGRTYTFSNVDRYADPYGVSISRPSINQGNANNAP